MLKTDSSSPLSPLQWATQEPKRQQACPTYAPGSDSSSGEEQGVNLKVKLQTAGAGKDMQLGQGLVGRV